MFPVRYELNIYKGLTNVRCATPEAISRRPLTAGVGIRYQTRPRKICGGQRGTEKDFLGTPSSTVIIFPLMFHSHLHFTCQNRKE
jgi:hypothetical protein